MSTRADQGSPVDALESGRLPPEALRMARRIARVAGDESDLAVLAIATAFSAVAKGSVLVDLADPDSALPEIEGAGVAIRWPDPEAWVPALRRSPVATDADPDRHGIDAADAAPLVIHGTRVYLLRHWQAEKRVAANLLARDASPLVDAGDDSAGATPGRPATGPRTRPDGPTPHGARAGDGPHKGNKPDAEQSRAIAMALNGRITILTGGPGTGKTSTIAAILSALRDASGTPPSVALAAPTGKAAARMKESIKEQVGTDTDASTVHRLLKPVPGDFHRFRRNRLDPLPHDVVIVDETSMMDVGQLDALLDAVRPDARLILVGDPDQLASVQAGNALADIVASGAVPVAVLTHNYRSEGNIPRLAAAIRTGDVAAVERILDGDARNAARGDPKTAAKDIHWFQEPDSDGGLVADWITRWGESLRSAAQLGDVAGSLEALNGVRVLCAHRHGPFGVSTWAPTVVSHFAAEATRWPMGQPMMITKNGIVPTLYNGDTGVVVRTGDGVRVAFREDCLVAPERLGSETAAAYALTTHKAQGSQFDRVIVVLPEPNSRLLTRELLYTALTRARREVAIIGSRDSLRAAVQRRATRASGLADRLRASKQQQQQQQQ